MGRDATALQLLLRSDGRMCPVQRHPKLQVAASVQNPESMPTGGWDNAREGLLWWGAVWGCCEYIATLVQVLMKPVTVCRRGGDADLDRTTLLRLLFMPGQQLVNWFPAQQGEPEPAEEPVWLGDGEGDARKVAGLSWDQWGGVQR